MRTLAGNLLQAWRLVFKAARVWTLGWIGIVVLQGLLPVAAVLLTRPLVNGIAEAIGTQGASESVRQTLVLAAAYGVVVLTIEFLQIGSDWVRTGLSELVQDYTKKLIHAQAVAVDLAFYESPEYYDQLYRAGSDASSRPLALLESTGSLVQNLLTLVGIAIILVPYGIWIPLALVLSTLPALYITLSFNRRYHRWWRESTPNRRWSQYYDVMLTHGDAAAELRLFGLGDHFQSAYQSLRHGLRTENLKQLKSQSLARAAASILSFLLFAGVMLTMVWRVLNGLATPGDLALFYSAFNNGQSLMRGLLTNIALIYQNTLFLGNLFEFLALQPTVVEPPNAKSPTELEHAIAFREITFRYAAGQRPALDNFDLTIPAGKVVAIVGPNGAGKSTLVKLLCRLYDPERGSIELDGSDLRSLSLDALREMITILFQHPVPYHATAGENISIADLALAPDPSEIRAASQRAGAHELIMRLPRGYDMMLGKWYADGIELSAGEWQRIALARAYIRRAKIILLDEPTSFMDSWSEADWFDRFRELAEGKTAILITHRFTVAMRADVIHVMNEGRIVESGTHSELMARGGLYAQSWDSQLQVAVNVTRENLPRVPGLDHFAPLVSSS